MFSVMDSLICEFTDAMNIVYQNCFKLPFRLSVRHVGRVNSQIRLLNRKPSEQ